MKHADRWIISRRKFLLSSTLSAASLAAGAPPRAAQAHAEKPILRFGIVTDAHYADAPDSGNRRYRRSLAKMRECVELMNQQHVDFLIELGDFKDQGKPPDENSTLQFLSDIESVYAGFKGPRYHVLGNHDVDSISKAQFLSAVENTGITRERAYYSFDRGGIHCVVLDANFRVDGTAYDRGNYNWKDANIPPEEVAWLREDLAATALPVICFTHQEISGAGIVIRNAEEIRKILAESRRVLAVFQGHHHAGAYALDSGIHYYTLKAMVEGADAEDNAYAIVSVYDGGAMMVAGYRRAVSKRMHGAAAKKVPHADDRDVICICKYNVDPTGQTDETATFRVALDDLRRDPEKRILLVPYGKYRTDRLHLGEGVTLHLEEGAELLPL